MMSGLFEPQVFSGALINLLIGNAGGTLGATSTIALLAGGIFLLYRRAIGLRIPLAFIGTVFILFWLCNGSGSYFSVAACVAPVFQICSGGLLLYALFMATDPVTSPVTPIGKICFGIGCGLLTFAIRHYSEFPENGWYSILIMNFTVPLLDRFTRPRRRGEVRIRE